jgi:hypothetical protein
MNIEEQLLIEHSRANATLISNYIGTNSVRFDQLMKLFFVNKYKITQRAAYSVGISIDNHPNLIEPYVEALIDNLDNKVHDAVKRNSVRILEKMDIPESHQGLLTEKCFQYLMSNNEPIAVKVFSMSILFNMVMKYHELKNELKIVIEDLMKYGTPAITSRGKKILKALDRIT